MIFFLLIELIFEPHCSLIYPLHNVDALDCKLCTSFDRNANSCFLLGYICIHYTCTDIYYLGDGVSSNG